MEEITQLLERELAKVAGFRGTKLTELKSRISILSRNLLRLPEGAPFAGLEAEAEEIMSLIVRLDAYTRFNSVAFDKITKKCDKVLGTSLRMWTSGRLRSSGMLNFREIGYLLVPMSSVYTRLRTLKESADRPPAASGAEAGGPAAGEGKVWTPPDSFSRSTTKYWVAQGDVLALKAIILRHLPVLVFGEDTTTLREITPANQDERFSTNDASAITSVYLDSDDFSSYHTRMRRDEGATLFRIRWYGSENVPDSMARLFVERKTHHESWTSEDSVKERFDLLASSCANFLANGDHYVRFFEMQRDAGKMDESKFTKAMTLARAMQEEIVARRLVPKTRTRYRRAAFQRPDTNAVRISLDTELDFLRESHGPGRFCATSDELNRFENTFSFPFAVLEIKLQTDAPAWITELETSGLITRCDKFSKFLSSCVHLWPAGLTTIPQW